MYDPTFGRFMTRDPIAEDGGVNVYAYPNDPINNVDPLGCADQPTDGSSGLGVIDLLFGMAPGGQAVLQWMTPESRRRVIVDTAVALAGIPGIEAAAGYGTVCGDGVRQGLANNLAVAELQVNGLINLAITGRLPMGPLPAMTAGIVLPADWQKQMPDVPLTPMAMQAKLMGIDRFTMSMQDWSYGMYFDEGEKAHARSMEWAASGQFLLQTAWGIKGIAVDNTVASAGPEVVAKTLGSAAEESGSGAGQAAALVRLRARQLELAFDCEQQQLNLREGLCAARYEQVVGRTVTRSKTVGADISDPSIGPVSLKGPLIEARSGSPVPITDQMIDGLADSVLADVKLKTFTKRVVVDTMRLTPKQKLRLITRIKAGLPQTGKEVFILE